MTDAELREYTRVWHLAPGEDVLALLDRIEAVRALLDIAAQRARNMAIADCIDAAMRALDGE